MSGTEYLGNDRFLHDIVSTIVAGKKNRRKDASIDQGAKDHGSNHRNEWPHRNVYEMATFLILQDIKMGIKPNPIEAVKLAIGHTIVDNIPSNTKTKWQLLHLLSEQNK